MSTTTRTQVPTIVSTTVLRTALGAILLAHGSQKLFGWFGGGGIGGTARLVHALGSRPGTVHAVLAGAAETAAGAGLAAGVATPAAGSAGAITMGVAAGALARNGFFGANGGFEHPALLEIAAASLALGGAGPISLDRVTGHVLDRPWMRAVGLSAVPAVVGLQLVQRARTLAGEPYGIGQGATAS